jgi:hypothetical protein
VEKCGEEGYRVNKIGLDFRVCLVLMLSFLLEIEVTRRFVRETIFLLLVMELTLLSMRIKLFFQCHILGHLQYARAKLLTRSELVEGVSRMSPIAIRNDRKSDQGIKITKRDFRWVRLLLLVFHLSTFLLVAIYGHET